MTDRLDLPQSHRRTLETLIREHLPGVEVWAYGSRVNGRSHDGSDLDLVLRGIGLKEIPVGQLTHFKEALYESTIPFVVEARDWARLPERFRQRIIRRRVALAEFPTLRDSEGPSQLSDHAEVVMGQSPPGKACNFTGVGTPLLNGPTEFGPHHPTPVQFTTDARKMASADDLLFCVRGSTTGRMNWADREYAIGRGVAAIRHKRHRRLQPFLRGVVEHNLPDLRIQATGSTFPNVTAQQLANIPWPAIDLTQQRAIAYILGTLDDKIELNRRMHETLDAMARALFKDWFVDFGPTCAKAEGMEPYLPARLWGMFPGTLDDQGIPVGWARENIGNHVVAEKGLSYKGAGLTTEGRGAPLHNLNSILEGGGYKNDGLKFYSGDYKPRHLVRPGDLIVANTEQGFDHLLIGYSSIVPAWTGDEGLFSHHLFKIQPRADSPFSTAWLHFAISASPFGEVVRRHSNGTTVNMLPAGAFEKPEITVPPADLIRAFGDLVVPKLRRMEDTFTESLVLAQLRDVLLPRLVSGAIQVSEAERVVEATTSSAHV